ncbi:hypothetical protein ACOSQ3_014448 [Xanthoceras sorbifolium]
MVGLASGLLSGITRRVEPAFSTLIIEALRVIRGLVFVKDSGLLPPVVETDALRVVNVAKSIFGFINKDLPSFGFAQLQTESTFNQLFRSYNILHSTKEIGFDGGLMVVTSIKSNGDDIMDLISIRLPSDGLKRSRNYVSKEDNSHHPYENGKNAALFRLILHHVHLMRSRLPKMTDEMIATLSVKETPADGSLRRRGGANLTFPQSGELRASDVLNVVAEILEQRDKERIMETKRIRMLLEKLFPLSLLNSTVYSAYTNNLPKYISTWFLISTMQVHINAVPHQLVCEC